MCTNIFATYTFAKVYLFANKLAMVSTVNVVLQSEVYLCEANLVNLIMQRRFFDRLAICTIILQGELESN